MNRLPYPLRRPVIRGVRTSDYKPKYYLLIMEAPTRHQRKVNDRLVLMDGLCNFQPGDEVIAVMLPTGKRYNLARGYALCMMGRVGYQPNPQSSRMAESDFLWLWRPPCRVAPDSQASTHGPGVMGVINPEARIMWFGASEPEIRDPLIARYRQIYFQ